jgi:hypothetical protein
MPRKGKPDLSYYSESHADVTIHEQICGLCDHNKERAHPESKTCQNWKPISPTREVANLKPLKFWLLVIVVIAAMELIQQIMWPR